MIKKYVIVDSRSDIITGYEWLNKPQINDVIIVNAITTDQRLEQLNKGKVLHEILGVYKNVVYTHALTFNEVSKKVQETIKELEANEQ